MSWYIGLGKNISFSKNPHDSKNKNQVLFVEIIMNGGFFITFHSMFIISHDSTNKIQVLIMECVIEKGVHKYCSPTTTVTIDVCWKSSFIHDGISSFNCASCLVFINETDRNAQPASQHYSWDHHVYLSALHIIKRKVPKNQSESSLRQLLLPDNVHKCSCLRDETEL